MNRDILEVLKKRRSIRTFQEMKVSPDTIERILKAGLLYPSSMNRKPLEFVVVEEKETLRQLMGCKRSGTVGLGSAPLAIVVLADAKKSDVWVEDGSISAILMQLEAEALGLGSVWIQIRNRTGKEKESQELVREVLGVPEHYGILCILAIGYKGEDKNPYKEDEIDFNPVHKERF